MAGQSVLLPFLSTYNDAGVRDAIRDFQKLGNQVRGFGKSIVGAFGGLGAVSATVGFIRNSADAARDYQQAMAGVNTVFGSYTGKVNQFIKASERIGMSHAEAARNVTFLGSVFKKTGIPMEDVIGKTESLVTLASDLASTYGHDVNEAMTGIAAMFRGEYDPIEKFGVAMKQNQVNALLAARGQSHLTGQMQIAAATLARYDLLMENSSDAHGAFARQANNLFEQQQILKAGWTDMQQALGEQLLPALVQLMSSLQPIISNFAPRLARVFESISNLIIELSPMLPVIADGFIKLADELVNTYNALKPLITGFVQVLSFNLAPIITFAVLFKSVAFAIRVARIALILYKGEVKATTAAQTELALAAKATPWGIIAAGVALAGTAIVEIGTSISNTMPKLQELSDENNWQNLDIYGYRAATSMLTYKNAIDDTAESLHNLNKIAASNASGVLDNYRYQKNAGLLGTLPTGPGVGYGGAGTKVKTFFDNLAEEVKKQAARVRLQTLGASEGLIDSITSGDSWEKTYKKILAGGSRYVASLQAQFNATKNGLEELKKAQDDAAKSAEELQQAYDDVATKILDFTSNVSSLLTAISPLSSSTKTLGAFEQAVVDSFDAITKSLTDAVDNKLLYQSSADDLAAFAKNTETTLAGIARQRDEIAKRISDANDLIASTKSAVIGFGNITGLLESQSQTIVETTTSVVDGIRLTLTKSLDVQGLVGDLTGNFQKVLDKTKKFAADLRELRRLGLDKNLFKQIVDAGVESGGATAAAIIAGGAATVSELNSVFADLNSAGADIAEQTAQVMFGAGVDVTNGLIEGLLSQDNALVQAAQTLADAFTSTFNARMTDLMNIDAYALAGLSDVTDTSSGGHQAGMLVGGNRMAMQMASVGKAKIYEVNINAGMVTDKAELGQAIVESISRYERTNGAVWQRVV